MSEYPDPSLLGNDWESQRIDAEYNGMEYTNESEQLKLVVIDRGSDYEISLRGAFFGANGEFKSGSLLKGPYVEDIPKKMVNRVKQAVQSYEEEHQPQ